jgi:hypothetical protein
MMVDLRDNIERLREQLCFLILSKELIDIEVINCSQELDKLLVEYLKQGI